MEAAMKWMVLGLMLMAVPARAEDKLNCKEPVTQNDMTQCAALDFEKADKALNVIWPKIKSQAEAQDKDTGKREYLDSLMASQRAWIAYRDTECTRRAMEMHGGSGEPMLLYGCKGQLTSQRIKDLQDDANN
jgi:uncharacterized protein YecT (DUF1311 family)